MINKLLQLLFVKEYIHVNIALVFDKVLPTSEFNQINVL